MLDRPESVWQALGNSHVTRRLYGLAQYQTRSALLDLDETGDVTSQSSGEVQTDASIRAVGWGQPLLTGRKTDLLAPYGQEVTLFWEIRLRGDDVITLPVGIFRIKDNDGGTFQRRQMMIPGREGLLAGPDEGSWLPEPAWPVVDGGVVFSDLWEIEEGGFAFPIGAAPTMVAPRVTAWAAEVSLTDRFRVLQRAKLIYPVRSPIPGNSMYDELRRLALMPVLESVPDRDVPASLAGSYDERMKAVSDLCALAGCVPALTREGALTLRPRDRWLTETVPDFEIDAVVEWAGDGQTDDFFNFVWAHDPDNRFSAFASIADDSNPLSVNRAGAVTYELSSPVFTTQEGTQAGAETALARLQTERSRRVTVTVGPQGLLLDLGDFGWFHDEAQNRHVLGEISAIRVSNDPTKPIDVDLIVAETR